MFCGCCASDNAHEPVILHSVPAVDIDMSERITPRVQTQKSEFTVTFSTANHGLILSLLDTGFCLISGFLNESGTEAAAWNRSCSSDERLCRMDRIAAVNGIKGTSQEIGELLKMSAGPVSLKMQRPSTRDITITPSSDSLGMTLRSEKNPAQFLGFLIYEIADGGAISAYNANCTKESPPVKIGDRIVSICNSSGDFVANFDEMAQAMSEGKKAGSLVMKIASW
eukprot:TRINITY_DN29928_c0_g2_i2.p1 TRINITY_DN29928_c0_g2~~TRINITY_DN29928_c0_g2_i2.p1  ORF type:complete len:225 (+),score=27.38 TRINITY_DN29928_c0_g2_i2:104-778(+)